MNNPRSRKKSVEEILIKIKCNNAKDISELNSIFHEEEVVYDDEIINCGNSTDLSKFYEDFLKEKVDNGTMTYNDAVQAIATGCYAIPHPRNRQHFASCVAEEIAKVEQEVAEESK